MKFHVDVNVYIFCTFNDIYFGFNLCGNVTCVFCMYLYISGIYGRPDHMLNVSCCVFVSCGRDFAPLWVTNHRP